MAAPFSISVLYLLALLVQPSLEGAVAADEPGSGAAARALDGVYVRAEQPGRELEVLEGLARVIRSAPLLWPSFDIEGRPILVNSDSCMFAWGVPESELRRVFAPGRLLRLFRRQRRIETRTAGTVEFLRLPYRVSRPPTVTVLYPGEKRPERDLGELARRLEEKVLFVDASSDSYLPLEEVEHLLIHEAFHFFHQSDGESTEPLFFLAEVGLEGRDALEWLARHDDGFRRSVALERCLARELARALETSGSHSEIIELLDRIFEVAASRWQRYGSEEIEKFWYATEGIATYLALNYRLRSGHDVTLSEFFDNQCSGQPQVEAEFHALRNGAVLWFALDRLAERAWREQPVFEDRDGYRLPFRSLSHAVGRLYPALSLLGAD